MLRAAQFWLRAAAFVMLLQMLGNLGANPAEVLVPQLLPMGQVHSAPFIASQICCSVGTAIHSSIVSLPLGSHFLLLGSGGAKQTNRVVRFSFFPAGPCSCFVEGTARKGVWRGLCKSNCSLTRHVNQCLTGAIGYAAIT